MHAAQCGNDQYAEKYPYLHIAKCTGNAGAWFTGGRYTASLAIRWSYCTGAHHAADRCSVVEHRAAHAGAGKAFSLAAFLDQHVGRRRQKKTLVAKYSIMADFVCHSLVLYLLAVLVSIIENIG